MMAMALSIHATIAEKMFDRDRLVRICDWLAVALAMSLPWSTSATVFLVCLWLIVLVPTLDIAGLRREVLTLAGGMPILLCALGAAGMLWADVSFAERVRGFDSFLKLLVIPLLIFHFRRSEAGAWVLKGFLLSCGILLVYSWVVSLYPDLPGGRRASVGVPVKDYISQSAMFTLCIAIAIELALQAWRNSRPDLTIVLVLLALAFLANIFFIAVSRTALFFLPILLLLFGLKRFDWKGIVALLVALLLFTAAAWPLSNYLQQRAGTILQELRAYQTTDTLTPIGERLEFWKKSLRFIVEAPVIGHGTGTISELFRRAATNDTAVSRLIAHNPHNQTLAVAIQLGLVGVAFLFAMWIAHLMLFRGGGSAAWIGLVVVVQNMVGSLFNSHLFDFAHGWAYVIGVGVAGGVVAAARDRKPEKVDVP
jgi:O-antigen ligase